MKIEFSKEEIQQLSKTAVEVVTVVLNSRVEAEKAALSFLGEAAATGITLIRTIVEEERQDRQRRRVEREAERAALKSSRSKSSGNSQGVGVRARAAVKAAVTD